MFHKHNQDDDEELMQTLKTIQMMQIHNQILLLHLLESATDMTKDEVVELNRTIAKEINESC